MPTAQRQRILNTPLIAALVALVALAAVTRWGVLRDDSAVGAGESGAGKSTIINLVSGFYFATDGSLLLDGNDMRDINLKSYRKHQAKQKHINLSSFAPHRE